MRKARIAALLAGIALLSAVAPAGSAEADLSPTARVMVAWIDEHEREAVTLLQRLVEINSGTMHFEGIRRVGTVMEQELAALGFTTRWLDGEAWGRAGHLVAERPGDGSGPRIVLIGHLDTVFEPESPFQDFERLDATQVRGPGIIDMKGGLVVMLQALGALEDAGVLDTLHLTVVLTGDEEKSGRPLAEARAALVEAAREADIALGFEDGDADPTTAVVARRGSTGWELTVTGTPAHSSQIFQPEIGAGAIFEAARILEGFRHALAAEEDLSFNPGVIVGGTEVSYDALENRGTAFGKTNVIAERVIVDGDLRPVTPTQLERARHAMRQVVADSLPGTSAAIVFDDGYPPMGATEGNRRLLALYDRASRDLGFGAVAPVDPRNAGAADVAFAAPHVEMALDGIGLMGSGGHTTEETADLATLPMQAKRAAVLLYRLSREPDTPSSRR